MKISRTLIFLVVFGVISSTLAVIAFFFTTIVGSTLFSFAPERQFQILEPVLCPENSTVIYTEGEPEEVEFGPSPASPTDGFDSSTAVPFNVWCSETETSPAQKITGKAVFAMYAMYFLACFVPLIVIFLISAMFFMRRASKSK